MCCEIAIHSFLKSTIKSFYYTSFGIPFGRKVYNIFVFHQSLEGVVIRYGYPLTRCGYPLSVCTFCGFRPSDCFIIFPKASLAATPVLALIGSTQAYLDKASMTVSKYRFPLLYLASFCTSTKSATYCSSMLNTNMGKVGKPPWRLGLCNM